jgi:hypothetical protein
MTQAEQILEKVGYDDFNDSGYKEMIYNFGKELLAAFISSGLPYDKFVEAWGLEGK